MSFADRLFSLEGKTALVTGGAGVQGRLHARTLAELGAAVALADRDAEAAEAAAADLREAGFNAWAESTDITSPDETEALAARMRVRTQRLDILLNNAGVVSPGRLTHEVMADEWARVLSVNLTGAFLMVRALMPLMLESARASIINNGSMLGLVGLYPGFAMVNAPYAAAKAGLFGLTRQVAAEYAARGVRCNAIAPGWHGGSGIQKSLNLGDAERARFEAVVHAGAPMGRRGRMEELCGAIAWLASDASSYVTGQVIVQDGGWTAV